MIKYKYIIEEKVFQKTKILLLAILYFLVFKIVYFTGGTKNVYPHLIYIPILTSSLLFGLTGGLLGGLSGGLMLAVIPVDTIHYELQSTVNFTIRLFFLTFFGCFSGFTFENIKKQYEKLEKTTHYDIITSLPNRKLLVKDLQDLLKNNKNLILTAINIDNIIEIFNVIGLSKSDLVLKKIATYFNRIKSDEKIKIYNSYSLRFEFILETYNERELNDWLKNFKDYIDNIPVSIEGKEIYLKVFLGSTFFQKGDTAEILIEKAYKTLSFAHSSSKDYYIYNDKLEESFLTTYLVSQAKRGIENDEFYLEYQPKLNIKENRVEEVEALIRWKHPELGLISPNEFIPKLEKTNIINSLTFWVLKKVLVDIKDWDNRGIHLNVAVNICPNDLKNESFIKNLMKLLRENKVDPYRINLEITETDLITDMEKVKRILLLLKLKEIKISIDDFGIGYSSLSYLNSFPVDYIKIDRSLIKNIAKDKKKYELLKNTIQMAHDLNTMVVVEGIEDSDTFLKLAKLGCEEIQGYYVSKALGKNDLEEFLHNLPDKLHNY